MSKLHEIFRHVLDIKNQFLWFTLAFHAGYLNAGGFLASHRFVSHMTGTGTSIGVSFGEKNYLVAFEMILAPLFFMFGAALAGYLVDRKIVKKSEPRLKRGVLIIILMNVLILWGGVGGYFGEFGEPLVMQRDFMLLFMLTFTCGLQNGLFVSLTSGQIKTTHITGLITDIGLNIVRTLVLKDDTKTFEAQKNWLRVNIVLVFSMGSFLSTIIFNQTGYWGFAGSVLISIFSLSLIIWITRVNKA
jgi:uncharacterized membrane protein YoaK (UPF0700 family)